MSAPIYLARRAFPVFPGAARGSLFGDLVRQGRRIEPDLAVAL